MNREIVAEALLAQLHPGRRRAAARSAGRCRWRLDDDLPELARIRQSAEGVDRELERLIGRHRRSADLPGHDLHVLSLDGGQDVRRREAERLKPFRVQPDPHAVRAGPEHSHLADARGPGQWVHHVDDRVVREEDLVEPFVLGIEAGHQQDVGGDLPDRDALRSERLPEAGPARCWRRSGPATGTC